MDGHQTEVRLGYNPERITVWSSVHWQGMTQSQGGLWLVPYAASLRPTSDNVTLWIEGVGEATSNPTFLYVRVYEQDGVTLLADDHVKLQLVDLNLAVDGDRNGRIEFDNSYDQQLTFWLNNDQEGILAGGTEETDVLETQITRPDTPTT